MKQQANLIRAGQVIEHDGRRWTVLKQQIITPGKGGAFIQVEMRDLKTGNKTNERWRTADTVERLMTEEKEYTYSYMDGDNIVLMDPETFEQLLLPLELLGDQAPFLQDNMTLVLNLVEGDPVGVVLPPQVTLEVVEADPVVKGQTASSSYKPARLSNGVKTMVPPSSKRVNASWSAPRTAPTSSAPSPDPTRHGGAFARPAMAGFSSPLPIPVPPPNQTGPNHRGNATLSPYDGDAERCPEGRTPSSA